MWNFCDWQMKFDNCLSVISLFVSRKISLPIKAKSKDLVEGIRYVSNYLDASSSKLILKEYFFHQS